MVARLLAFTLHAVALLVVHGKRVRVLPVCGPGFHTVTRLVVEGECIRVLLACGPGFHVAACPVADVVHA
ncbi:hypothetical protein PR202_ga00384 [Eleusine coracana subsp. coracana]|uniref:Secreted protein n=1 Tax=Eleusine coracana subsp. coracana TaxID=191504 RepID=A0AAV5BCE1_ELECO|nr:hypothetical protein PR202_ga00384 [Eleusine coracana subsp. coracana]